MSVQDDLNPSAMPFDVYVSRNALALDATGARQVCHAVAMAKRILMQEKVRDFTAADVVALAGILASRK